MEIHAELKTASKMFCGCANNPFHAKKPNSHTCPVCLGMPGGLPVANKTAIEWTIKLGLALNCKVNLFSKFDRKHYFYPDLPKGYQISQYDIPFCEHGYLETNQGKVRITRIHLEEDTGKLLHTKIKNEAVSLVDFNRSGVPLVEIVSEPDIHSPVQAVEYAKALRKIIRYLDIGDCDMEQGGMRLEANVSVSNSKTLPSYKVELKNINSFRFLEQAMTAEVKRQTAQLEKGEIPAQETRGFNPKTGHTFVQRSKEEAADYRYFPDPDLPPISFTATQIERWQTTLPELPERVSARWQKAFSIAPENSNRLITNFLQTNWLDKLWSAAIGACVDANKLALALINKKIAINLALSPTKVLDQYSKLTTTMSVNADDLTQLVDNLKKNHPSEVSRYQSGETKLLGFFIGQAKKQLGNKIDVKQLTQTLKQVL